MLQIRRSNRYNLGIISHISTKIIFCDPPLELSRRDGSNEGSQRMFSSSSRKFTFELSAIPTHIWSSEKVLFLPQKINSAWTYLSVQCVDGDRTRKTQQA